MSNLATMERLYEAWIADDLDTVFTIFDPAIRLNPDAEATWADLDHEYVGHDGVRRYMQSVYDAFEDYRPEVEKLIEAGPDQVLTLAIEHGRGRGSGAEVKAEKTAHLWTLRDGRAVQVDLFLTRAPAFEAAGLPAYG